MHGAHATIAAVDATNAAAAASARLRCEVPQDQRLAAAKDGYSTSARRAREASQCDYYVEWEFITRVRCVKVHGKEVSEPRGLSQSSIEGKAPASEKWS